MNEKQRRQWFGKRPTTFTRPPETVVVTAEQYAEWINRKAELWHRERRRSLGLTVNTLERVTFHDDHYSVNWKREGF